MTKRKNAQLPAPPPEGAPLVDVDPAEAIAAKVTEALGEDPTAMIWLQRQDPDKPDVWKFLRKFNPGEFDEDVVREQFGGGAYRVRVKNRRGQHYGGVVRFDIDGPPRSPDDMRPVVGTHVAAPQGSATADKLLDALLQIGTAFVAAYAARPQAQPTDPVALVREMAAASKESTKELAEMVGLRNELAAGQKKESELAQALDVLKMGMRIGRGMSGDGEGGGTFGKLLDTLTPILNKAVAQAAAPAANPPLPSLSTPEPAPVPKHPLVAGFEILLEAAQAGSRQPEAYAEIAAERVPGLVESLDAAVAEAGGVAAMLIQAQRMDPAGRIEKYHEFFHAAVTYLLAEDDGEPEGDGAKGAEGAEVAE